MTLYILSLFPFAGMLFSLSILLLTLLEDKGGGPLQRVVASGDRVRNGGYGGVHALRFTRQTKAASITMATSKVRRGSEATATKLGPAFHTEPPEKFTFSNDSGKYLSFINILAVSQFFSTIK